MADSFEATVRVTPKFAQRFELKTFKRRPVFVPSQQPPAPVVSQQPLPTTTPAPQPIVAAVAPTPAPAAPVKANNFEQQEKPQQQIVQTPAPQQVVAAPAPVKNNTKTMQNEQEITEVEAEKLLKMPSANEQMEKRA